jgi:putative DNA primase/helicase
MNDQFLNEEVATQGESVAGKSDSAIVAEKETPFEKLENSIEKVDLVGTLKKGLGDPLYKYVDEEGNFDRFKIPQNLYIVAIIHEVMKAGKKINLGICVRHKVIYLFTGKYWLETNDEDIKRRLSNISVKLGYYSPAVAATSEFKKKLFEQFMDTGIEEASPVLKSDTVLINLNNGTLEIIGNSVELRPHNRDDFLTYALDYNYDSTATAPVFKKFIDEVLPDQLVRDVLQEFMGFIFTTDSKLEKCAVLYGGGANGKSVFFEVISRLMGKENMSYKSLGDICQKGDKGNNHRSEVEGKLINYSSEISPVGADYDIFKGLVSGEPVTARRLYKDVYTFANTAKLMFNANKLPTDTERTHGYFRRFLIIPFDVTIAKEKQDAHLHTKIISKELPGVMNWTIEGLKRLLVAGKFTNSKIVDGALESYKKETNSALLFIDEYSIVKSLDGFTSNQNIYNSYTEFCNNSGYRRLSQTNLSHEFIAVGLESTSRRVAGKKMRGFCVEFGG